MKLQLQHKIKYLITKMRIVSMVPSWTETLIEAGCDVVGRTRFCIHPSHRVTAIPAIGGTKLWNIEQLQRLKPDLVILDKEENTEEMGRCSGAALHVTHVQGVLDVPREMEGLARATGEHALGEYAERLRKALSATQVGSVDRLPGITRWIRKPSSPITTVIYVIWKNPWMAVSPDTFIGSMLSLFVDRSLLMPSQVKYPKFALENLNEESTLLLFSSEPFPFEKHVEEMAKLPFASALVDGESWSWFGVRSLRFLESISRL